MPRIRISTEPAGSGELEVLLDERIVATELASERGAAALIERIGWALIDADDVERRYRRP